jgi:ABC-type branched-subunit amino acid transport system substrate-binding protein
MITGSGRGQRASSHRGSRTNRPWVRVLSLAAVIVGSAGGAVGLAVPSASASSAPITLALVTSLTGPSAPETASDPAGFLARIDLQNSEGGVNGHKLIPLVIDDRTDPSEIATAVQSALAKGAFGIISASPIFFLAAKYPQQQGVPVTGSYTDGPEWGEQPYTNMFASDLGSIDPSYPVNTLEGKILRQFGGTVLGSYGYSISPTSSREAAQEVKSFEYAGGKLGVLDTSLSFGTLNFTSAALVAKQHHVDALFPTMIDASNFALAQALKQAGVKVKAAVFATGYDPSVGHSPAWPNLQGDEFLSIYRPFSLPDAGTEHMAAAFMKYEHFSKTQFPTLFQYESWAGADLMIKGLQMAGANPTRADVIKDLRSIRNYTANGLLPKPIDYATVFGHDPPQQCVWVQKAEPDGFVPHSSQPVCGTDIKGSATARSSRSSADSSGPREGRGGGLVRASAGTRRSA